MIMVIVIGSVKRTEDSTAIINICFAFHACYLFISLGIEHVRVDSGALAVKNGLIYAQQCSLGE